MKTQFPSLGTRSNSNGFEKTRSFRAPEWRLAIQNNFRVRLANRDIDEFISKFYWKGLIELANDKALTILGFWKSSVT